MLWVRPATGREVHLLHAQRQGVLQAGFHKVSRSCEFQCCEHFEMFVESKFFTESFNLKQIPLGSKNFFWHFVIRLKTDLESRLKVSRTNSCRKFLPQFVYFKTWGITLVRSVEIFQIESFKFFHWSMESAIRTQPVVHHGGPCVKTKTCKYSNFTTQGLSFVKDEGHSIKHTPTNARSLTVFEVQSLDTVQWTHCQNGCFPERRFFFLEMSLENTWRLQNKWP